MNSITLKNAQVEWLTPSAVLEPSLTLITPREVAEPMAARVPLDSIWPDAPLRRMFDPHFTCKVGANDYQDELCAAIIAHSAIAHTKNREQAIRTIITILGEIQGHLYTAECGEVTRCKPTICGTSFSYNRVVGNARYWGVWSEGNAARARAIPLDELSKLIFDAMFAYRWEWQLRHGNIDNFRKDALRLTSFYLSHISVYVFGWLFPDRPNKNPISENPVKSPLITIPALVRLLPEKQRKHIASYCGARKKLDKCA